MLRDGGYRTTTAHRGRCPFQGGSENEAGSYSRRYCELRGRLHARAEKLASPWNTRSRRPRPSAQKDRGSGMEDKEQRKRSSDFWQETGGLDGRWHANDEDPGVVPAWLPGETEQVDSGFGAMIVPLRPHLKRRTMSPRAAPAADLRASAYR